MIYLDSAATSLLKPRTVHMAVQNAMRTMASPGRGGHRPALLAAETAYDCRALLADTATEGYVLLDMYDLENIQAFVIANGAEHTIRDYSVSIYKDKENGGLEVGVTGQSFRK